MERAQHLPKLFEGEAGEDLGALSRGAVRGASDPELRSPMACGTNRLRGWRKAWAPWANRKKLRQQKPFPCGANANGERGNKIERGGSYPIALANPTKLPARSAAPPPRPSITLSAPPTTPPPPWGTGRLQEVPAMPLNRNQPGGPHPPTSYFRCWSRPLAKQTGWLRGRRHLARHPWLRSPCPPRPLPLRAASAETRGQSVPPISNRKAAALALNGTVCG